MAAERQNTTEKIDYSNLIADRMGSGCLQNSLGAANPFSICSCICLVGVI